MHSCTYAFTLSALLFASVTSVTPHFNSRAFEDVLGKRQTTDNLNPNDLVVDLGYERYQGFWNSSTGLNNWLGIRYAAPPTGRLRWQAPTVPALNRGQVLQASTLGTRCPQSPNAPYPPGFNFTGDEDCLSLNIWAPPNVTNLPVMVWIHGGGYGSDQVTSGNLDLSAIINTNDKGFIGVEIQYRLGAFGFLSSDEVMRFGTVNAGLLDQTFALQWVQNYIGLFGGDPSRVTIAGESAGGGSVMLQVMAFGGYLGNSLFQNAIAASPYLPQQYNYGDFVPSQSYYAFAAAAGCFGPPALPQGNISNSVFQCLVSKDTQTLQNASARISSSSRYGTWAFLPVTDGVFVQQLPSQQLLKKQINGVRALLGNNANEGPPFTPQNIVTEDDFVDFIANTFPLFTPADISKVLFYYPSSNDSNGMAKPGFATTGISAPTALNESSFGSGQQQRADNVYAETTFVCPSYWLAEAFASPPRLAYKYQYSVPAAQHATDPFAYFGPPAPEQGSDFTRAFMRIWGDFVTRDDPGVSVSTTAWPPFSVARPYQLNLNESGGTLFVHAFGAENVTEEGEPGLRNAFDLVDAYSWEGGRGTRCDFWRSVASLVPE